MQMRSQWLRFIDTGEIDDSVSQVIQNSWVRSRAYGVDPFSVSPKYKSELEMSHILESNERLIQVSRSIIEKVHASLGQQPYIVTLHNSEGVIIEIYGGSELLQKAEPDHIKVGTIWSEEVFGTSGPATALATAQPILVTGCEHYVETYHGWECASSPIWDRLNHKICGILTLGTNFPGNPLLLPMVTSLTEALSQAYEWSSRHHNQIGLNLSILDQVDDLILMIDKEGTILAMNFPPFYEDIFQSDFRVGKNYFETAYRGRKFNDEGKYNSYLIETLETGKEYRLQEHRRRLKDGTEKVLLVDTKLIKTGDKVVGALIVAKDITVVKKMEEQLSQFDKFQSLSKLAAGLAHEIRNPLTSSLGFIQMINRSNFDLSDRYMRIIEEELKKINHLVQEFLLLSKPSAPQMKRESLLSWVHSTVEFMQGEARLNNIECICNLLEVQEIDLRIDMVQMKRALINLLKNSFDASSNGGKVEVYARRDEPGRINLYVRDWGKGMDETVRRQIFDPFFTAKESGTGLGLTIVYQIVQAHNGTINVHSAIGMGTTIIINLPVLE
jgi:two-component system, sporulation sensor kinase E